jgi:hypothetical protein
LKKTSGGEKEEKGQAQPERSNDHQSRMATLTTALPKFIKTTLCQWVSMNQKIVLS